MEITEDEYKKLNEIKEKQQKRFRYINARNKEKYDQIAVHLPKGTKARIKLQDVTANGLINELVLKWLDEKEKEN